MLISDLPIGAKLKFGTFDEEDIRWIKVSADSDFIAETRTGFLSYDRAEGTNVSRARRNYGNNFFPHSNIAQWLNAIGLDWFHSAHEYDEIPQYNRIPGFLSNFAQKELESLVDREIVVAVPLGSRKEFGKTYRTSLKVCLPSASEIGYEDDCLSCEGEKLDEVAALVNRLNRDATVTRTGVKDGGHVITYFGSTPEETTASRPYSIHPMIRIRKDVEISDAPDGSGYFYIPDTEFINKFLEVLSFD